LGRVVQDQLQQTSEYCATNSMYSIYTANVVTLQSGFASRTVGGYTAGCCLHCCGRLQLAGGMQLTISVDY